jgi:hypothetical protein
LTRTERGSQSTGCWDEVNRFRGRYEVAAEAIAGSKLCRSFLDLERMRRLVADWPAMYEPQHYESYVLALDRAVALGLFVLWVDDGCPVVEGRATLRA